MKHKKRFHFKSIKSKVFLSTLIPVFVSFFIVILIIFTQLHYFTDQAALDRFHQVSSKFTYLFDRKITDAKDYLSVVSALVSSQAEQGTMDRAGLSELLIRVFKNIRSIDGSSIYFEPNAFDGLDEQYIGTAYGTSNSGRIAWYIYWDDDQIRFMNEALSDDQEFLLPIYTKVFDLGTPVFTEPTVYEIDGVDFYMITVSYPIRNSQQEILGVVTVDVFLDDFFKMIQQEQIYDSGYLLIYTDQGTIIYSPDFGLIGSNKNEIGIAALRGLGEEKAGFFATNSMIDGSPSLAVVSTIYSAYLNTTFYIAVIAPEAEIYRDVQMTTLTLLIACLFFTLFIGCMVYFLVGRSFAPLKGITRGLRDISDGKYKTRIMGEYDGEFAVVKDSVNDMAQQIEHYIEDLEHAKELAEHSSKAKGEFLSRMSHEMRTPMNAIIGMTGIALKGKDTNQKEHCLQNIHDASHHLLGIINDILDISKIEAQKFETNISKFKFSDMIQSVFLLNQFRVESKNQVMTSIIDDRIPELICSDEQHLTQVITNLISNAVKFTPEEGVITCSATLLGNKNGLFEIQVDVTDTGIGIARENQDRLFQSFEQSDGSIRRKYGGTGLGLAISKHIVEMHGGTIWVDSKKGQGSTFSFTFWTRHEEEVTYTKEMEEASNEHTDHSTFAGKNILLVDDIEINREIVMTLLDGFDLSFDCAADGRQAVNLFTSNPERYDLILMDMQMPEVDGLEATRQIRSSSYRKAMTIPIIAMTANVFKEDVEQCMNVGMNDHIGKPIDYEQMLQILRKYLK